MFYGYYTSDFAKLAPFFPENKLPTEIIPYMNAAANRLVVVCKDEVDKDYISQVIACDLSGLLMTEKRMLEKAHRCVDEDSLIGSDEFLFIKNQLANKEDLTTIIPGLITSILAHDVQANRDPRVIKSAIVCFRRTHDKIIPVREATATISIASC